MGKKKRERYYERGGGEAVELNYYYSSKDKTGEIKMINGG